MGRVNFDAGDAPRLDEAMDWLLNGANLAIEITEHFWHIADGRKCDCAARGRIPPETP